MFRNSLLGLLMAVVLLVCHSPMAFGQVPEFTDTFYVNPNAMNPWGTGIGDGDGLSWDEAFITLVDAIQHAPSIPVGTDIVIRLNVAGSTSGIIYQGHILEIHDYGTTAHTAAFSIPDNMLIYGGYEGVGLDEGDRDPAVWITTISGVPLPPVPPPACGPPAANDCFTEVSAVGGCDDIECCWTVCTIAPECCEIAWTTTCVQNAITFCGSNPVNHCPRDGPFVVSVIAVVTPGTNRRLDGVTVTNGGEPVPHDGESAGAGGGIYITSRDTESEVGLDIVRCVIIDNRANSGGGIALFGQLPFNCDTPGPPASARIWNCQIVENRATTWGGGVFARYHAPYQIVNTVIARNGFVGNPCQFITDEDGAALAEFISPLEDVERLIINCTITRNESGPSCIAQNVVSVAGCQGTELDTHPDLLIVNSVVRNNWYLNSELQFVECGDEPMPECLPEVSPLATLHYCNTRLPVPPLLIPATWHDCIDVDPGFVKIEPDPNLSIFDDYRLLPTSAMIDAGTPPGMEPDLILSDGLDVNDDGSASDSNLDLVLERRILPAVSTGCPRVDIGAYERLTADSCLVGDFNNDCKVDGNDLGFLLNNWGPCAAPCPADLTCDGTVDGADLGELLNGWGLFPRDCCEDPESLLGGGESEQMSGSLLTAAELAELLGFPSVTAMVDWLTEQPFGEMAMYLSLLG